MHGACEEHLRTKEMMPFQFIDSAARVEESRGGDKVSAVLA